MPLRFYVVIAWLVISSLGVTLRMNNLVDRPMHADEATGARILAERLESSDYNFNPKHFHGPTLSLSTVPIAKIYDESSWPELSKLTLRLSTVIAGSLLLFTPLLFRNQLGEVGALCAGAFLASSPLLVYYSRVYIHESWFALFTMLALAALYQMGKRPNLTIALLAGLCIGLMYATKETFVISIISWGISLLAVQLIHRPLTKLRPFLRPLLVMVFSAAFTAAIFYSDGFRTTQGIIDAIRTYFVYETTEGHEKPFAFYLNQLIWPKNALGTWWTEAGIAVFAVIALLRNRRCQAVLFLAIACFVHLLIYSLIGYKTPWLMLVPWAHACLLAGFAFRAVEANTSRIPIYVLLAACLGFQSYQSFLTSNRFENDPRNPYVYVPTSQDMDSLSTWLGQLALKKDAELAVVGSGYWPLPWYLRSFENIGYWPEPKRELKDKSALFVMPEHQASLETMLKDSHTQLPRSLRENVAIYLYLENGLWQQWMNSED